MGSQKDAHASTPVRDAAYFLNKPISSDQNIIAISVIGNSNSPNRVIELLAHRATLHECAELPGDIARRAISYADTKTREPLFAVGCWTYTEENRDEKINLIWKHTESGEITCTVTREDFFDPWVATATASPNQKGNCSTTDHAA